MCVRKCECFTGCSPRAWLLRPGHRITHESCVSDDPSGDRSKGDMAAGGSDNAMRLPLRRTGPKLPIALDWGKQSSAAASRPVRQDPLTASTETGGSHGGREAGRAIGLKHQGLRNPAA